MKPIWSILKRAVSEFIVLFALMFRYLPDVRTQWKDIWTGAAVTALLFSVGKLAIGFHLGRSSVGSAYGAAIRRRTRKPMAKQVNRRIVGPHVDGWQVKANDAERVDGEPLPRGRP